MQVDNPVDGSKIKFSIDQSFFGGKDQSECATLIRSEIARQMKDAGMDVSALHMYLISSQSSGGSVAFSLDPHTLKGEIYAIWKNFISTLSLPIFVKFIYVFEMIYLTWKI